MSVTGGSHYCIHGGTAEKAAKILKMNATTTIPCHPTEVINTTDTAKLDFHGDGGGVRTQKY